MDDSFDGENYLSINEIYFNYDSNSWIPDLRMHQSDPELLDLTFSPQGYEEPLASPPLDWGFGQETPAFPAPQQDYFSLPISEFFHPEISPPLIKNEPAGTNQQPRSSLTMICPRPPPADSDSGSQGSPTLPAQPSLSPQQLPREGRQSKTRGRRGRLDQDRRKHAANTRHKTACLFHKLKRVKCHSETDGDDCDVCLQTGRLCYRFARIKDLEEMLRAGNNARIRSLLEDVGSASSSLPLRFEINITPKVEWRPSYRLDLQSYTTTQPLAQGSDVGKLNNDTLLEIGKTLLVEAGVKQSYLCDAGRVDIPTPVWNCLAWHIILKLLPTASYSSSGHQADVQAIKRFVTSLVYHLVQALRREMLSALSLFKETIDNKVKIAEDPGHYQFTRGFAAMCRIADDMMATQSSLTDVNTLSLAVSGAIYPADAFYNELHSLSYAFHTVKDANVERREFDKMINEAMPRNLSVGFVIVFDPSKSESSLTLEGKLTQPKPPFNENKNAAKESKMLAFISEGDVFTTQPLIEELPIAHLFGGGSSAPGSGSETSFFQYKYGPTVSSGSTASSSPQESSEEGMNKLPLREPVSSGEPYSRATASRSSQQKRSSGQFASRKRSGSPSPAQKRGCRRQ